MSSTLHRDRVVLPSKEEGAIKLEAFLKEARTGPGPAHQKRGSILRGME